MKKIIITIVSFVGLMLSACGGGQSSSVAHSSQPASSVAPSSQVVSSTTPSSEKQSSTTKSSENSSVISSSSEKQSSTTKSSENSSVIPSSSEKKSSSESSSVHVHTFAEEWTNDATHHWHAATCGHDVKDAYAEHAWGNWQEVVAPGCSTKGSEKRVCSVCLKEETRDIDPTGKHTIGNDGVCTNEDCALEVFNVATEGNTFENFDVYEGKIYIHFMTQCNSKFNLKFNFPEKKIKENFGIYERDMPDVSIYDDLGIKYESSGSVSRYYSEDELSNRMEHYLVLELASGYEDLKTINMMVSATAYHDFQENGYCGTCSFDGRHKLTREEDNADVGLEAYINNSDGLLYSYVYFDTTGLDDCCPLDKFYMDTQTLEKREGAGCVANVNLYYADGDNLIPLVINKGITEEYDSWESADELMKNTYYLVEIQYAEYYEDPTVYFSFHSEHEHTETELGFDICGMCDELLNGTNVSWGCFYKLPIGSAAGTYLFSFNPCRNEDATLKINEFIEADDKEFVTVTYYDRGMNVINDPSSFDVSVGDRIYAKLVTTHTLVEEITIGCECSLQSGHYDHNGFCSKCGAFLDNNLLIVADPETNYIYGDKTEDIVSNTWIYFGYYANKEEVEFTDIYISCNDCDLVGNPCLYNVVNDENISLVKVSNEHYKIENDVVFECDYYTIFSVYLKVQNLGSDPSVVVELAVGEI